MELHSVSKNETYTDCLHYYPFNKIQAVTHSCKSFYLLHALFRDTCERIGVLEQI